MEPKRSPWREPMVWMLVALPLASVVASALLITAALRSGGDDAIADPVQSTAQIQVSDLGPDLQAQQRQLSAVLRVGAGFVEVLPATGDFDRRAPLQLSLRHPTIAAADLALQLQPTATGWRARIFLDSGHDWRLQLAPSDGRWRILGRLPKGQQAVRLAPVLSAP
jgi:hypothetical protein